MRYINDTTLLVFDDGNTRHADDPKADSRGQEWILNEQNMTATLVVNADMGNYSSALGSSEMLSNGNLAFTSGVLGRSQFGRAVDRGSPQWHQDLCAADERIMSIAPTSRAPSTRRPPRPRV